MIDWWALRWMPSSQFADLVASCGLALDASDLTRLADLGLLPPLEGDGEPAYSVGHLLVLWSYRQLVAAWRHPWLDSSPGPVETADLEAFRERFRPFRDWVTGTRYDEEWWDQVEAKMQRVHPLGQARQMGLLLDSSVLESASGEARLFLELDRFFAAWRRLLDERRRAGRPVPTAVELRHRPELDSASGPYPPVQRPAPLRTGDLADHERRPIGLDEADLRGAPAPNDEAPASRNVPLPGEAAREHARRAAEETSALIQLAVAEERPDSSERLESFEAHERELFSQEAWEELAEHYRASLDIFNDDQEVGRVLKKLALIYLEKLDQPESGTHFYLRALERLPTDRGGLETANRLLTEQKRWEELAAIWQRTATHAEGSQSSEAWMHVASILLEQLRNMPEAIQALRFALEADPTNVEAREALSNLAALSPEERSGSHDLEATRSEWSRLAEIAERWAARQDNDDEAAEWYLRAAELHLSGQEGVNAAFACLEAALERDPERNSTLARLESLARHQERWETFREIMICFIDRESTTGSELQLSLVAETLRERLKRGGVPEEIYEDLLERLPPATRRRESQATTNSHSDLARQIIEEASAEKAEGSAADTDEQAEIVSSSGDPVTTTPAEHEGPEGGSDQGPQEGGIAKD